MFSDVCLRESEQSGSFYYITKQQKLQYNRAVASQQPY